MTWWKNKSQENDETKQTDPRNKHLFARRKKERRKVEELDYKRKKKKKKKISWREKERT